MSLAEVCKLASEIAAELNKEPFSPTWTMKFPKTDGDWEPNWAELVRADGATIVLTLGGYRMEGRVEFCGAWPKFKDGTGYSGGKRTSITCSASRSAKELAKDIQRRLLPIYLPEFHKANDYVRTHDANAAEAEGIAKRIAQAIGARIGENKSRRGDGVTFHDEPDAVRYLTVHPGHPSYFNADEPTPPTVDFRVHGLDPETAVAVLQLIRESEQRKAAAKQTRIASEDCPHVDLVPFEGNMELGRCASCNALVDLPPEDEDEEEEEGKTTEVQLFLGYSP